MVGTLARLVHLPSHTTPDPGEAAYTSPATCITPATVRMWGDTLLHLLLHMKHNGAVEKAAAGLLALSERLLQSNHPLLVALPTLWLDDVIAWI